MSARPAPKKPAHPALTVKTPDAGAVRGFRAALGLNRKQFARLAAVSERAVADWEADKPISAANQKGLKEAQRLYDALTRVMRPQFIGPWLDTPNDAFAGLKPLDLIDRGEVDRLWRMVFEVESGAIG
jgi:hypothetical protein